MWEAIRDNHRRSWALAAFMFGLLIFVGWALGMVIAPDGGAWWGAAIAVVIWTVQLAVAHAGGDELILHTAGARRIAKEDAPQLWNVVEEMTIAAGLGAKMPRVYVIDDALPNAFAVGRRQESASIAVTSGLLSRLNRDELQGVVAHEMGHIVNRDVSFMVLCSVMVGTIVILAEILMRAILYGGGRSGKRGSSKGGGQGAMLAIGLLLAILAPLFAQIIYFACSRRREYLADASAARFTRYPEGLASALEKIGGHRTTSTQYSRALAPLYIVNPLQGLAASSVFSTHPPLEARIRILRQMAGAGYKDYEVAYEKVFGRGHRVVGARTLAQQGESVAVRAPAVEPETKAGAAARAHEALDLVGRLTGLLTLYCPCGVWIKLPPGSTRRSVACPRCGRENEVPMAAQVKEGVAAGAEVPTAATPPPPLVYQRKGKGWETFRCDCGKTVQLSPALKAPSVRCRSCRREIEVV